MNLIREPYVLTKEGVKKVEELKNAKWLLDTEHKGVPVSVFWQDVPHPKGSNFFALYYYDAGGVDTLMIIDGAFITKQKIKAVMLLNGDVIYSRYRHDYFEHRGIAIDGGRDYLKVSGDPHKWCEVGVRVTKSGDVMVGHYSDEINKWEGYAVA
jgi:hypothetical protein